MMASKMRGQAAAKYLLSGHLDERQHGPAVRAGTRLVRAFNTIGYTIIASEAGRPDPKLPIPIAGDDAEAVQVAAELVRDAGFEPVIAGRLVDARRFQRGAPGYGPSANAAELREKLRSAS